MGKGKFIITENTINSMRDYVPLEEKKNFLADCAARCFDKLQISADGGTDVIALPPMYKKNTLLRQRYIMGALLSLWFGICYEKADEKTDQWLMSEADYDYFSGSHIFNQLDRMKSHVTRPENKDKIFDMLADYRELEKMLNDEIYGLVQCMNDPITRLVASIQATATPENLKEAGDKLKAAKDEIERYAAERKAGQNG